ncbi:YhzD family protein [Priestia koreensis]|uniref:YhzD-like protein n=1 Tax=Priestia koreensis TaxID=284581 RepID=A0A0M0L8Z3_9BACI|nr:YhzD family protein [Priestia koreensis]KOO47138.1 hypothetical protein AMD01_07235 [Priestia koreensis]MCM3004743.1 hypothetical protein [Priestia koreensis]UNL85546.1 hypothetical protein IE339_03240 [Priestia koreensis]
MGAYTLTVFEKSGEKLIDETFEASTEAEAKQKGTERLSELKFEEHTHRCTSAAGKLVLFHR